MQKFHFTLIFVFYTLIMIAQSGTVRGVLTDDTGTTIPFANILIEETGNGFSTDLDGAYSVDLPVGIYSFKVSYIGYADLSITEIQVKESEVTIIDISIASESEVIDEVVITAKQTRNTENALMAIQRKSTNVIDGISSQSFRRIGDGDAASAIKRVTGVSVEGGKYVFVRGLGDRYTKTILNGMDIPGLDPDKNSLQMDIFPTNIMDNIIVSKSFTPDLPGDFSGGVVNIYTKDFPEQKTAKISIGTSYNPNMHFNNNYISSEGSNSDWLGYDNGMRDLKLDQDQQIPTPIDQSSLATITSRFTNNMATMRTSSLADANAGISFGNQINKAAATIGYNAALNYKNTTSFYEDVMFNSYIKSFDKSSTDLLADRTSIGDLGSNNVLVSGMVGGAVKLNKHKFSLNALHIQNGESTAGLFERNSFIRASNTLLRHNIEYTESSISNFLLSGKHSIASDFNINWKLSPTFSSIEDKDIRVTPYRVDDDGSLSIEPSEGAQPRRLFRNLEESNYSSKIDFDKAFGILHREVKLQFGASNTYKVRDYGIQSYLVNVRGQSQLGLTGNPDELFAPENIWTPYTQIGTYITGNYEPTNTYNANQNIFASYVMAGLDITEDFKATAGVRLEKFSHRYSGQNNIGSLIYENEKILSSTDFLPAVNFIYKLNRQINLRGSYSKTLARPSFKEASIAQIYDAISDRTFIGNIGLQQTDINNYDLRAEAFLAGGEMISVSGFLKTFVNPIEIVAFSSSAPDDLQPRNVGNATVKGIELELRKNFGFISEDLKSIEFVTNITLVDSEVELDKSEGGEYESRKANVRDGEIIKETRDMQGQSPYIVNAYLNYRGIENGWEANVSYNVQGSSLAVVGMGINPDVYTSPFHNMSVKISKQLGLDNRLRISATVKNILGSNNEKVYRSFGAEDQIFESFRPLRSYSLGLSYDLF